MERYNKVHKSYFSCKIEHSTFIALVNCIFGKILKLHRSLIYFRHKVFKLGMASKKCFILLPRSSSLPSRLKAMQIPPPLSQASSLWRILSLEGHFLNQPFILRILNLGVRLFIE